MAVDGITDDILVEILSRVPAKSLCRFKCVSKHWLGLTNDRNYLKKLPQTLTGFFYSSTTEGQFLESPIVFTSLSGSHGCPPIDTSFAFLPSHQRLNLLDCCNGLLLFRWYDVYAKDNQFLAQKKKNKKDNQFRYVVCNLATEKWTVLPDSGQADKPSTLSTACTARLGFDPAVSPHFHVFELEEEERALSSVSSPESANCLAAVDTEAETWTNFAVPDGLLDGFVQCSQGRLHYANFQGGENGVACRLVVYVLEDYDSKEWILKHSVEKSYIFKGMSVCLDDLDWIAIHPQHNLIFFTLASINCSTFMSYNMDSQQLKVICDLEGGGPPYLPYMPLYAELPWDASSIPHMSSL
ncbi:hypothetical protein BRADI_1g31930v3 [Brachypodium distachyon]|uniref:F-box domain-containing protein n=1 Tax=Brachypodium distachyon TaxID=15368 RepID=A0A0Q3L125_BRADI|nr:hypothetical protein BRADI_1g31930v3 [Brachypodium distachyon]